jgi:hypothetical protein
MASRHFRLSAQAGEGVRCDDVGLFVGPTALLERIGEAQWRARDPAELDLALGEEYGLPVDISHKVSGIKAIADALTRGDLTHAQLMTLHLQLPAPSNLRKVAISTAEFERLRDGLRESNLLKGDWDPAKHPRWPAKSPDSVGGQFAPSGGAGGATGNAALIPAQELTLDPPWLAPMERPAPLPFEITPPPFARNPYPERAECAEEWAEAEKYCSELLRKGRLGKGDYRGMGRTYKECVMGQVSEGCGGNELRA